VMPRCARGNAWVVVCGVVYHVHATVDDDRGGITVELSGTVLRWLAAADAGRLMRSCDEQVRLPRRVG